MSTKELIESYEERIDEMKDLIDTFERMGCKNDIKIAQQQIRDYMEFIEDLKSLG